MNWQIIVFLVFLGLSLGSKADTPPAVQTVLDHSTELAHPVRDRLPLFILPISGQLASCQDVEAEKLLIDLDRRGIGYTVNWSPSSFEETLSEGLRIGKVQQRLGMTVGVNANACLYSFFDGSKETLHVDADGNTFKETSFGGELGCPFALGHRHAPMKDRVESFLRRYKESGVSVDFIFADWEIDGPMEWNDAWQTSKRCQRCREHVPALDDFRTFQKEIRRLRSKMQREVFGNLVTNYFPEALVGNYAVYPHSGTRYWYDYFEKEPTAEGIPVIRDQKAPYREWVHEFDGTGYTFAMPVVYTWYPIHGWYAHKDSDYRWFYNMLLVGSNAGQHTPSHIPIIPFVHWHTTSPPTDPAPHVKQFSQERYQDLLWHLLLRGHDTFFLWCLGNELGLETKLVHEVYAASQRYSGFLKRGEPILFDVPKEPGNVISGLRLGNQVLVKRTTFENESGQQTITLSDGSTLTIANQEAPQVVTVGKAKPQNGFLTDAHGNTRFPIGFYEMPGTDEELQRMAAHGVNLIRCGNREDLDRAQAAGMMGWLSLGVQDGATEGLRQQIESVKDHPALVLWEGPDEIVWTFTAYSFLKDRAGFTREDWENQKEIAVNYAQREGKRVTAGMREGIRLVRELDQRGLPFWVNEAADSDAKYARDYMDHIDITGCDYYAVRSAGTDLPSIGRLVRRWDSIGFGRPVYMVLQAFSWHALKPERGLLYPSFNESRFMAYDAIVHGGRGIFYWGSNAIDDPSFRTSLYAVTKELAILEGYLSTPHVEEPKVALIDDLFDPPQRLGVRARLFHHNGESVLLLVNEDDHRHLGVDVSGLATLDGRPLHLAGGHETIPVKRGRFVTRMQAHEVKVFVTDRALAKFPLEGRGYTSPAPLP